MKAIQISSHGGPEVMQLVELPVPEAGEAQVLVRQEAAGVNFIDIYQRSGLYPVTLPYVLGLEGAGTVEVAGAGVTGVQPGDRVAYAGVAGAYAEYALLPAERVVKLPEAIDCEQGAAVMLQGMTAHYLAFSTYPLKSGDTALIHAAAGGVGLLLVQIAKLCDARVLATVSTLRKAELARKAGADEVILYTEKDFAAEVKALTQRRGVEVVYDSVGQATFAKSLDCLAPRGMLVCFGQSSGKIGPLDPALLASKGSLFLTRPMLFDYIADRRSLEWRSGELFNWIASGKLFLYIGQVLPLALAADAHRLLQERGTMGKTLLAPWPVVEPVKI